MTLTNEQREAILREAHARQVERRLGPDFTPDDVIYATLAWAVEHVEKMRGAERRTRATWATVAYTDGRKDGFQAALNQVVHALRGEATTIYETDAEFLDSLGGEA